MPENNEAFDREVKLNQVYLAIISRYKDYIEEKENISVAELPTLVTPKSELVLQKAAEIKSSFGVYSYDENFYEASIKAFHFVKDNVEDVLMPLQFWLTPHDTMTFMIGDVIDRNVLLCSLLVDLGNPSAKVLVSTKDSSRKVFVHCEFKEKHYVYDINGEIKGYNNKEEIIKSLNIDDETTTYEFNDKMYIDIS